MNKGIYKQNEPPVIIHLQLSIDDKGPTCVWALYTVWPDGLVILEMAISNNNNLPKSNMYWGNEQKEARFDPYFKMKTISTQKYRCSRSSFSDADQK